MSITYYEQDNYYKKDKGYQLLQEEYKNHIKERNKPENSYANNEKNWLYYSYITSILHDCERCYFEAWYLSDKMKNIEKNFKYTDYSKHHINLKNYLLRTMIELFLQQGL